MHSPVMRKRAAFNVVIKMDTLSFGVIQQVVVNSHDYTLDRSSHLSMICAKSGLIFEAIGR